MQQSRFRERTDLTNFRSLRGASLFGLGLSLCAGDPAVAQATDPRAEALADSGEILVTAQKRSESAQRVPISIAAFSGETLEKSSVLIVMDFDPRSHNHELQYISPAALAILHARNRNDEFLFAGQMPGKPLSNMAMEMCLRRMGSSHYTVHGFHSAFRGWVGEATSYPCEVAEMALAHAVGNAVERAYRGGDSLEKRRELMNAWAHYCTSGA